MSTLSIPAYLEAVQTPYAILAVVSVIIGLLTFALHDSEPIPDKVPKFVPGWPLLGPLGFWTARREFHLRNSRASDTGRFSYMVGRKKVVALSESQDRKIFFDSPRLSLSKGYAPLAAGVPPTPDLKGEGDEVETKGDNKFVLKRLVGLLKRENFIKGLAPLIADTRARLGELGEQSDKTTDPFESVYGIVFQLTMRTLACKEVAEDRKRIDQVLSLYEMVAGASIPALIVYPRILTLSKLKRTYAGTRIYMIFDKIINDRAREGRREADPLQYLLDQGDKTLDVITVVMGSLFAGQLNTGITAAWNLVFLAHRPEWKAACRREAHAVADKHCPDRSLRLSDRLAQVPLEAWEEDFPVADAVLHETIRFSLVGSAFRKNVSDQPVSVGDQVIPAGWFASYHLWSVHFDPELWPRPEEWRPERYVDLQGNKATDPDSVAVRQAGKQHSNVLWGTGRHPCPGMRFAKLEMSIIMAFFIAEFDWEQVVPEGRLPKLKFEGYGSDKPEEPVKLRYWKAEEGMDNE